MLCRRASPGGAGESALRQRRGEPVAEGRFRVDAGRAMERLRKYRFTDPSHWVLEVVRAAVASGATEVTVRTDADDVEVRFDGDAFPAARCRTCPSRRSTTAPARR